jgi:hypothetical protein
VLINLSGAAQFTATVDFLIYNDNEEVFSALHSFRCGKRVVLSEISGAFDQPFLLSTSQNHNEAWIGPLETGWYRLNGNVAYSTAASVDDPAILAVQQIEAVDADGTGAELPFGIGAQTNGALGSHSILP